MPGAGWLCSAVARARRRLGGFGRPLRGSSGPNRDQPAGALCPKDSRFEGRHGVQLTPPEEKGPTAMATTMFIRHRVSDFTKWRQVYEEVAPLQQAGGVVREAVYQSAEDPNDVTVMHDFASAEEARAFAASRDLK